jgi:hypothetical protein
MIDLQYPVGKFQKKPTITNDERRDLINQIAEAPGHLRKAVAGLSVAQLDTPYRPDGWTVRQVAHHLPDSHLNAYVRTKLALTESQPTIKPYNEKLWAELHDVKAAPVEVSLTLLESLHERWVFLLRSLAPNDFLKTMMHPEHGVINLDFIVQMYAWHGRHHVAHITSLRRRMGWK